MSASEKQLAQPEEFIDELAHENKKLEAELQQIIAQKSFRGASRESSIDRAVSEGYIQIEDQAESIAMRPSELTARFAAPEEMIPRKGVKRPTQSYDSVIADIRAKSGTLSSARSAATASFVPNKEKYEATTKKCKNFELRLIGAQKAIKILQESQKTKDDEIVRLKQELESKRKVIENLAAGKQKSEYDRLHEIRHKQTASDVDQTKFASSAELQKINAKLHDKIREQEQLLKKYRSLIDVNADDTANKEE